jgi:hypothetical protein
MSDNPLYVYAVVRPATTAPEHLRPVEPSRGSVTTVVWDEVGALVSPMVAPAPRMSRDNLEAHQRVVEEAAARGPVLPMRFGVVVDSRDELVDEFLRPEGAELCRLLAEYTDCVEMRVEALYRENVTIREAAAAVPGIRKAQKRIAGRDPDATYYDRIHLGELVASAIEQNAARDARRLGGEIATSAHKAKRLRANGERVVFRGAFLVRRRNLSQFDNAVSRIADRESERMEFHVVGPLAPWDFVEVGHHPAAQRSRRRGRERLERERQTSWAC